MQVKKVPSLNAKLSDIALGTSAAPTLLPPIYFKNGDEEFNLVDGALVASNPALLAVNEVIQQLNEKNSDFIPMKANEPTKILLLSLGCGITPDPIKIDAFLAQFFPAKLWIPLVVKDLASAVGDTNEYHLQTVFSTLQSPNNYYLRIE
ncbi:patatin-like phospholipase, partial [Trifolium medium]|nr:patatin-like phospholipase [Trifolium medium]